jgi:hypothetical protein
MIDIDRMVSRLVQLVQDTYPATSQGSCREDSITEMFLGNHL